METIQNIILLPWTLLEWAFSLVVWYIIISLVVNKLIDRGIDSEAILNWFHNTWEDFRHAIKWRKR